MERKLTKTCIESWCGNVLPLRLLGGAPYGNEAIRWECDDPCVQITTFAEGGGAFTDGVLLTLLTPGEATVNACLNGVKYPCHVSVRPRKQACPGETFHYYVGDFHDHCCKSHNKDEVCARKEDHPWELIRTWKQQGALDFAVISDHADLLNHREFYRGFVDAETEAPMDIILFPGSESENSPLEKDRYGVTHKNAGEIVTVNAAGYASTDSWEDFYAQFKDSPFAISVLAHPQIAGHSVPGIWNFCLEKNNTPQLKQMVKLVEMGNGGDRSCNLIHEYVYSVALDNGFRVSVTCSSDSHGPDYDLDTFPGRTVIMAPEKSKEAFAEAIWNNRVYATSSGNVKLFYSVNAIAAPGDLPQAEKYAFHVELSQFREAADTKPVLCQVISDYGKCVKEITDFPDTFDFTVESDTARYFYLRLSDAEGRKTWSCPVFTGRPCDAPVREEYVPLEKTGFTAVDTVSGEDAGKLINDDPSDPWISRDTTCTILIDMQEAKKICALGHYPRIIDESKLPGKRLGLPEIVAELPRDYRISTSCDGVNYTCRAEGLFRVFGGEELVSFETHSARYVKLEILATCGAASQRPIFQNAKVAMGEITPFTAQ